jgi:hypothetical protein
MPHQLDDFATASGRFEPVWTLEIQTLRDDTDRVLDPVIEAYPLAYGKYERNTTSPIRGASVCHPPGSTCSGSSIATFRSCQASRAATARIVTKGA